MIFDLGNVLIDFRWEDFIRDRGCTGELALRVAKASVKSPVWQELDRGAWTKDELLEGFISNDPEIEQTIRHVFSDVTGILKERPQSIPWIRSLKKAGYKVFYLSNFSSFAYDTHLWIQTLLDEMDGGILSYREKLIKPDPVIYRLLLDRYALNPKECVFFDDTAANIEAAKNCGIHGIVFTDRAQADAALLALGVKY